MLASCRKVTDADAELGSEIDKDVDGDMPITIDALAAVGIDARAVAWDDPSFDWSTASAVIVRSTWDYHRHVDEFLAWLGSVSEETRLHNQADVIAWNIDKHYLAEFARAGIPIIDTLFIDADVIDEPSESAWRESVEDMTSKGDIVVKPVVSAGSNDTRRHADAASAQAHIDELLSRNRAVMVQPYITDVDTQAETGLVYIDGEFSHAFSKGPMLATPGNVVGDLYLAEVIEARSPTASQRALGDRVMAWVDERWGTPLYARVDTVPTGDGPVIIEVELAEPSLYLHLDDGAPARFAEAIRSRLSDSVAPA